MSRRPTVLIAGGGTGGHIYPGIAVADRLHDEFGARSVFVGTARGLESIVVPEHGYELELMRVEPLKGRGIWGRVRGAATALVAMHHASALLRALRPDIVLSVGGYAAGPVALMARLRGTPIALCEPNSHAGLTHRWLAPWAERVYTAWPDIALRTKPGAIRELGVPLRAGFERPEGTQASSDRGQLSVLVLGGSQGAQHLNDTLPVALARVAKELSALEIVHQTGRGRDGDVRERYARAGIEHVRVIPHIEKMAERLAEADIVVARAGAGTIAEITAIGRASILIPFPFAADDHQTHNARALERAGAARCLPQSEASAETIARAVLEWARDPAARQVAAESARVLGRPDAALAIARDLLGSLELAPMAPSPAPSARRDTPGSEMRKVAMEAV